MNRFVRFTVPMAALALLLALSYTVRADDKPAAATGTVTVTVTDKDGNAVEGANVRVHAPHAAAKSAAATGDATKLADDNKPAAGHLPPIAEGKTDKDGKATLENVPVGDYSVSANMKGTGSAREKITVKAGETVVVALKLAPRTDK